MKIRANGSSAPQSTSDEPHVGSTRTSAQKKNTTGGPPGMRTSFIDQELDGFKV